MLALHNAPKDPSRSPVEEICQKDNLPREAVSGLDTNWRDVTFCSISQIAAIACIQLAAHRAGVPQENTLPTSDALSYLQRMNYCRILDIGVNEDFTRHPTADRFVSLSLIPIDEQQADPCGIAGKLGRVVLSNTQLSKSAGAMLNLSFSEIIDNVVQHSAASFPGLACAQYYKNQGFVELCVADCGIGISNSMGENPLYSKMSLMQKMLKAFDRGDGQWRNRSDAGFSKVGKGMGLSFPAIISEKTEGHMWVISHETAVHIHTEGRDSIRSLYYPGTIVIVRIPDRPCEILESDVKEGGRPIPVYYETGEGISCPSEDQDPLWG